MLSYQYTMATSLYFARNVKGHLDLVLHDGNPAPYNLFLYQLVAEDLERTVDDLGFIHYKLKVGKAGRIEYKIREQHIQVDFADITACCY